MAFVDLAKILLENFQSELSRDTNSYGRVILYLNSACQERALQEFVMDIRDLVSKEHSRVNTTPNWLSNYQLALSLSKSQNYDVRFKHLVFQ